MNLFVVSLLIIFPIISNGVHLSHEMKQSTIYCGRDTIPGQVPFYASIDYYDPTVTLQNQHKICNGVLIANRWVLTEADFMLGFSGDMRVVLGDKLNNKTIGVEAVYVYSGFNPAILMANIALLLLKEPVQYSKNIQPICLPEPGEDETFYGKHGTVAGWGRLGRIKSKLLANMQIITPPIIGYDACQKTFTKAGYNEKITESFLCAGYPEGEASSCSPGHGDPLMVKVGKHWVLAGIGLDNISCWKRDLPAIYIRVGSFLEWISKTIHHSQYSQNETKLAEPFVVFWPNT